MKRRIPAAMCMALIMLAVLLLFTFPFLSARRLLFMGDITTSDITELNFPAKNLLSSSLREGRLPLWDPDTGCGFPLLSEGQSGMLYPLNLIAFLALPPVLAFNLSVALSLFLSLLFTYILSRHYGLSRPSSLFAAIAFTFSGFVVAKMKFTYMVQSIAWFPLAVYGLEKALRSRQLKFLALTTTALALQLLAGGPQIFYITLLLLVCILAWRTYFLLREPGYGNAGSRLKAAARLCILFFIAVLLAISLAAPQFLPQVAGFPYFNRSYGMDFNATLVIPMQPRSLSLFFSPYQHGNPAYGTCNLPRHLFWEDIAYPGLLTLVLSLVALVFLSRKDRDVALWFLVALVSLLVALGDNTPLARFLWRYVPGFGIFRFYQRFMLVTVLGMSVLAGKALDYVFHLHIRSRAFKTGVAFLALAVLVTDLGLFAHAQMSTIDADSMLAPNETVRFLRENLGDDGSYRYASLGEDIAWKEAYKQAGGWMGDKAPYYQYYSFLPPNFNDNFALPNTQQYGNYGLTSVKALWGLTYYGRWTEKGGLTRLPQCVYAALALQGAKYVVTPLDIADTDLRKVSSVETGVRGLVRHIYELKDVVPRAAIFTSYQVVESSDSLTITQMDDLLSPVSKIREKVILEKEPPPLFEPSPDNSGSARIVHSSPSRVVVKAEAPRGGMLLLSDAHYPEWHAYVDGAEREIIKANFAFRAVALEPGTHTVEFVFRPSFFYYGVYLGAAGLLLMLLLLLYGHKTRWMAFPAP
ncbi:MAG: YfhO family protein [Actinomycetota bacterium]|nr:YfhO family protein [Actinomycetota bacterium]